MKQGYIRENKEAVSALVGVLSNIVEKKNPYGKDNNQRTAWQDTPVSSDAESARIFYFSGCVSAFDQVTVPQAFAGIMKKLDVSFAVSNDEWCCGLPLFWNGDLSNAKKLARHNLQLIEASGADTVVFSCPTCLLAFTKYMPAWLNRELPFKALHTSQFLDDLKTEGKLKPKRQHAKITAVYHDSCHLGRELGIYREPRKLLEGFIDNDIGEFPLARENSECCGGGGLVPISDFSFSNDIARKRIESMPVSQPDILVAACPNCKKTLGLAMKKSRRKIPVLDLMEVIDLNM